MAELKLKQVRSKIGSNQAQRATLRSLKLGGNGSESVMADTPAVRSMVQSVIHLVKIDEEAAS